MPYLKEIIDIFWLVVHIRFFSLFCPTFTWNVGLTVNYLKETGQKEMREREEMRENKTVTVKIEQIHKMKQWEYRI